MKDNIKYNQPIIFQRREIVKHFKIDTIFLLPY